MAQRPPEGSKVPPPAPQKPGVSRRAFITTLGATGVVAALADPTLKAAPGGTPLPPQDEDRVTVTLKVNGQERRVTIDPRATLLDCLRESLDLTGTKKGCDHGQCGACTVHVNGRRVNSCMTFAVMNEGAEITTIEGLGEPGKLHPMQEAFVQCDGYQCGYCTSGQIMSAVALLNEKVGASDENVKERMSGNICRCGAYPNIVAAIQQVRRK
jgi:xanthine dehydrogenase YagT iron-sulfur-binding subunit